jgi:hypothetical protein
LQDPKFKDLCNVVTVIQGHERKLFSSLLSDPASTAEALTELFNAIDGLIRSEVQLAAQNTPCSSKPGPAERKPKEGSGPHAIV